MGRRPKDFASFVGQQRVARTLKALCDGAGKVGPLPMLLLVAAAGFGKTTMAEALARYLVGHQGDDRPPNFRDVHAGKKALMQIHSVLTDSKERDVIFIDEAHALEREDAELLYLAVDRSETLGLDEKGRLDRSVHQKIKPITLIIATNLPGSIPKALYSRSTELVFDDYSDPELREIARRVSVAHDLDITSQAIRILVEHSDRTPRGIEQLLTLLVSMPHPNHVTQGHVEDILRRHLGHDGDKLTPHQRRLVKMLAIAPMRAEQVSSAFGFDAKYVRTVIENPLVVNGVLTIRPDRTRALTAKGLEIGRALLDEEKRQRAFEDLEGL